jgi:ATP-binding cassette subfamily A (ABC1) protein 3
MESISGIESQNFETEPQTKISIKIKNLRKTFGGYDGEEVAVDNVSLNIYFGQITVLLGHNGAGKTTTMNMITGIFPPTSGSVSVDGFDIVTATDSARRSLGLCPQV